MLPISDKIEILSFLFSKNLSLIALLASSRLDEKILFASQDGKRVDFSSEELLKSYVKHPLMTFKIISAIHFEAFKLWLKGIKFIKKKLKIRNNITFEN